jgi:hypothetical protein
MTSHKLLKCSLPDDWEKSFASLDETVAELRKHICDMCLTGNEFDEDDFKPVDVILDGVTIECRDPIRLLGTACGCEYEIEGDLGFWRGA